MSNTHENISRLIDEVSLINFKLQEIKIFSKTHELIIELSLALNEKQINIRFTDVVEYGFYYNNKHIFYNVVDYKFLITEVSLVYISLDPDFINQDKTDSDQDFVLARGFEYF